MQDKNMKPPRPYDAQDNRELFEDVFSVASTTDCTGLIPAAPDSAAQVESYGEIYDIPLSRNTQTGNSANSISNGTNLSGRSSFFVRLRLILSGFGL